MLLPGALKPRKRDVAVFVLGYLGCLATIVVWGMTVRYRFEAQMLRLQRELPSVDAASWTLTTMDGKRVPFKSLGGRVLLVNLWATWCAPCIKEMPSIEALAQSYDGRRFQVLMVSTEDIVIVRSFLVDHPHRLSFYVAKEGMLQSLADSAGVPRAILLDCNGIVVEDRLGARDWTAPEVKATIDRQLDRCG